MESAKAPSPGIKRPVVVTVIAWFNIALSGLFLVFGGLGLALVVVGVVLARRWGFGTSNFLGAAWSPVPIEAASYMVSGIAMLRRLNWGRVLYLVVDPVGTLAHSLLYGFRFELTLALGTAFYLFTLVLLLRPAASAFFSGKQFAESMPDAGTDMPRTSKRTIKTIAAVFLFAAAVSYLFVMSRGMLYLIRLEEWGRLLTVVTFTLVIGIGLSTSGIVLWGKDE